jgi:hypothetical protein
LNVHDVDGLAAAFRSFASVLPPVSTTHVLPSIVLRSRRAAPPSRRRRLGHGDRRFADARGRATVGGEPERVGAVELQHVGEELEALGQLGVRRQLRGHRGDDTRVSLIVCLPTYDERVNLEPMVGALGTVLTEHDLHARVLVIDDASPTGRESLPTGRRRARPRRPTASA